MTHDEMRLLLSSRNYELNTETTANLCFGIYEHELGVNVIAQPKTVAQNPGQLQNSRRQPKLNGESVIVSACDVCVI